MTARPQSVAPPSFASPINETRLRDSAAVPLEDLGSRTFNEISVRDFLTAETEHLPAISRKAQTWTISTTSPPCGCEFTRLRVDLA
jgi:hypothetical protein